MSQPPLEALPDDIARLLEREKDAYPVDPERQRAVRSRVEMAIALGAGGIGGAGRGGPAPPPGVPGGGHVAASAVGRSVAGKIVAVGLAAFVGGGVTGGAIVRATSRAPVVAAPLMSAASASPLAPSFPVSPAPMPSAIASAPTTEPDAPSVPARANAAPSAAGGASVRGDIARERELLDVARAALAHGQTQDAIAALQEHARRWPHGTLAEEREVVLIQALATAGRLPEAKARAARFHQTFPASFFASAVDAAVSAAPAKP